MTSLEFLKKMIEDEGIACNTMSKMEHLPQDSKIYVNQKMQHLKELYSKLFQNENNLTELKKLLQ